MAVLRRSSTPEGEAAALFEAMDRDGDGRLAYSELLPAALDRDTWASEAALQQAFRRLGSAGAAGTQDVRFDKATQCSAGEIAAFLGKLYSPAQLDALARQACMRAV